jgi:ElaB/YqjD/DUF883 family membrane-anchored ribosome-binding protein
MVESASKIAERAARAARETTHEMRDRAGDVLGRASEGVSAIHRRAASRVDAATADVQESAREAAAQLRDTALDASDRMINYLRDEPLKSVLIAGVAGVALVAIASLLGGSRTR